LIRVIPYCLPIIAVVAGAIDNREMVERAGRSTFQVYRKRFIERKREL